MKTSITEQLEKYESQINEFFLFGKNRGFDFENATEVEVFKLIKEYAKYQIDFFNKFNQLDNKQKVRALKLYL